MIRSCSHGCRMADDCDGSCRTGSPPPLNESVAIKLYRNYSGSGVPWAELDEWKKQAWRAEAEDVLS